MKTIMELQQRIEELTESNQALCDEVLERDAKIERLEQRIGELEQAINNIRAREWLLK